jgi:non-homologous end joining protein Ku
MKELLKKKQAGEKIEPSRSPAKVINLMDALRQSVETERGRSERRESERPAAAHHRTPKKAGRSSRQKKAG